MKSCAGDLKDRHTFLARQGPAVTSFEQGAIIAREPAERTAQPVSQPLTLGRWKDRYWRSGIGLADGAWRATLLSSILANPIHRSVIDARGEKRGHTLCLANARRTLQPPPHEIHHDILGGFLVAEEPARETNHLSTVSLVQEAEGARLASLQSGQ